MVIYMKHWKPCEIEWLINNYPSYGQKESAKHLLKSEPSIRAKASRLGLKQDKDSAFFKEWQDRAAKSKIGKKRPDQADVIKKLHADGKLIATPEKRKKLSSIVKERWKNQTHPKGMLNKKHSKETLKIMSQATLDMWANPNSKVNQDEHRQQLSDRMMENQKKGILRNGYSRGSQGKREDLGNIFFRSSWEANYARYLNFLITQGHLYKWEFEPDTFWFESIKRGVRSYLPDFKLWDTKDSNPYYVEVKGWMDDKSKTKIKRMAKYYPDIRLDVVAKKEYTEIKKKLSRLIQGWE